MCEELTGGDPKILEKEPYAETPKAEKPNYKELFASSGEADSGSGKKRGGKAAAACKDSRSGSSGTPNRGKKRKMPESPAGKKESPPNKRPIVHPRSVKSVLAAPFDRVLLIYFSMSNIFAV